MWTHTTHFLASSPNDLGFNLLEDRMCQPTSSKGWMRTRVLGYSPPINTFPVGVGPSNQRVLARRRSLPTKGCPCDEAEATNILSRGWGCRDAW